MALIKIGSNGLGTGVGGKVLQVVQDVKSDTSSITANASIFTTISNLTATITPTSASSKILVNYSLNISQSSTQGVMIKLLRDTTVIGKGNADGNRVQLTSFGGLNSTDARTGHMQVGHFLDTPNTTNEINYKVQIAHTGTNSRTLYINRTNTNENQTYTPLGISTISLIEIAG